MKISLDTNGLYVTRAGTARYIQGLLRGFQQIDNPNLEISPLAWPVTNFDYHQPRRMLKTFYREMMWAKFVAPKQLIKNGIQLYHATASLMVTPPPGLKWVITLLDVAVLRHPERFRRWHLNKTKRDLRKIYQVDTVTTISKFTADEAIKLLGLPAKKINVIHIGCDFHPNEPRPAERAPSAAIPNEFFLFVGSLEPGKNLALLRSVYQLAEERKIPLPPLVIVGARWKGVSAEQTPPKDWLYLGHVPDEELVYLYRHAHALVFPSKYEGFGLPIVEAMSLGCPVICSPVASLPEVAGDAALMLPLDANEYLTAMGGILHETQLRGDLVAKGVAQSAKFSWKRCAEQVAQLYQLALSNR